MSDVTSVSFAIKGNLVDTFICCIECVLKCRRICSDGQDTTPIRYDIVPMSFCSSMENNHILRRDEIVSP